MGEPGHLFSFEGGVGASGRGYAGLDKSELLIERVATQSKKKNPKMKPPGKLRRRPPGLYQPRSPPNA